MKVRIEKLRFPANVPAGMNFLMLGAFAYRLRSSTEDLEPIVVRCEGDGTFTITDGRHRAVAALIAGRSDILAIEDHPEDSL